MRFITTFCLYFLFNSQMFGANIVCSVVPLFSIAKELLKDIEEPHLLIESQVSPHVFIVKPTSAQLIETADLVIWIGDQLETGLQKFINKKEPHKVLTLMAAKDLFLLPLQTSDPCGEHEGCDHHHSHLEKDPHIWLSFTNLTIIIDRMSEHFILLYPDKNDLIKSRANTLKIRLADLFKIGKETLKKRQIMPIAVYHNGYQYFFQQYGLPIPLTLTYHPEAGVKISAYEKVSQSQETEKPICIFTEVQFPEKIVERISKTENTKIKIINPLGDKSQNLYQILEGLQNAFFSCYPDLKSDP